MDTYLNPKEYYNLYSELLDVSIEDLKKGEELCDPCDIDKETLKIPIENLELIKKNLISL
jgi:hypothetical protein